MGSITVDEKAFKDLKKVKEEFDSIVESIELMNNKEFMKSYKKAKKQVQNREFDDWDGL